MERRHRCDHLSAVGSVRGHVRSTARAGDLSVTAPAERDGVRHQSMARAVSLLAEQGLVATADDEIGSSIA